MHDSNRQPPEAGFLAQSMTQCGRVFSRSLGDLRNVIYSKNDLNTVTTTAAIVGAAILAPTLFTVAGVMSVAGAALGEPDYDEAESTVGAANASTDPDPVSV